MLERSSIFDTIGFASFGTLCLITGLWIAGAITITLGSNDQAVAEAPAKQGISHRVGAVAREAVHSSGRAVRQGMQCGRMTWNGVEGEACVERERRDEG